ncbi:MAG TPA: tetratricopeptide repeat protein [Acetobacteraceae bacterium]
MTHKTARLLDTALALDAAGDRRGATTALERLVRRDPFHSEASVKLANFDIAGERYAEAIQRIERLLRVKPDLIDARATLATAYLMSHRVEDARACAVETVKRHADSAWARVILARVRTELGEHEAAYAELEAADGLGPSPVEKAEIQYELGRSFESQGRHEESVVHFERATVLAPALAHAHQAFGAALLRLGRFRRGWVEHEWRRRRALSRRRCRRYLMSSTGSAGKICAARTSS